MYSKIVKLSIVKSSIALLLIAYCLLPIAASAQYSLERIDSLHYRFCTTTQDQAGNLNKSCSPVTTRDSAIGYLGSIADRQRAYIDAHPWDREWAAIDSALKKYTGSTYDQHVRAAAAGSLAGDWTIVVFPAATNGSPLYGKDLPEGTADTLNIKLTLNPRNPKSEIRNLKVSGGSIRGECELIDNKSIRLTGVLAKPVTLTAEKGRLVGIMNGKEVVMKRQ